ncbi:MAG TPA: 4Fe-4S binding protein [Sumerlaeia bacterium]|nr:4Fe-4S binding protein [Sumerlaeia bacterium]
MSEEKKLTRSEFLAHCGRGVGLLIVGGVAGGLAARNARAGMVWQIDPNKCNQCGQCATHCVRDQSAVKCFHAFEMCGYCELCSGFLEPKFITPDEGAENQLCPVGAIVRQREIDPYYSYEIDESRCIGCARCVKGCTQFGNGSLYLQVRHDLCLNCNECSIAAACPSNAFVRVPANKPYIPRLGANL